jgi:hypothetical protein
MEQFGFILVFLFFIVIIGGYFYFLTLQKPKNKKSKQKSAHNISIVKPKWLEIQEMLRQGGPANFRQVIVEADKLVDMVLKSKVDGESMGERLRNGRQLFEPVTYQNLWTAHKLRNKVVHEAEFEGLSHDAKVAAKYFEQALKELRVL